MAIDRDDFARVCVEQGLFCGIHPHYLIAAAQFRSGIADDTQNGRVGPFRLAQAEWDANRTADDFGFDFLPQDINDTDMQCSVYALMAHRAFDAFGKANNRDPNTLELYLQQWSDAQSPTLANDLQAALASTVQLYETAAAATPGAAASVPGNLGGSLQNVPDAKVGPVLTALITANTTRAGAMQIKANLVSQLDQVAQRLVAPTAKARYQAISATTGVPWFVIAVIHEREASQRFDCSIAQGDPWNQVSRNVPAGRGPFASFEEAAVDALTNCAPFAARWGDWSVGGALTLLEQYNGLGYARRDLPSPYIWASTDQYVKGKFTSDHHFDPNVVDSQLGCAAMLSRMKTRDPSIVF